eukprot:6622500-Pyramimonas_sp.AAC.1
MVDGMLTVLLGIGNNINIAALKAAQTFTRVSRCYGHDIKKLTWRRGSKCLEWDMVPLYATSHCAAKLRAQKKG